jgi:hypothetical protein
MSSLEATVSTKHCQERGILSAALLWEPVVGSALVSHCLGVNSQLYLRARYILSALLNSLIQFHQKMMDGACKDGGGYII